MAKVKLTKGELKRQRDSLEQFRHYLPTLQLKKQQLQAKILESKRHLDEKEKELKSTEDDLMSWVGVLADPDFEIKEFVIPETVNSETANIAGATIPVFKGLTFKEQKFDLYTTPFWVDRAFARLKKYISDLLEVETIKKQITVLQRELRVTTQRVNLFEKVKIPECLENIRKIRVYLGDQMANAVGISKVAKEKIQAVSLEGALS